jgi:hypothetical protein
MNEIQWRAERSKIYQKLANGTIDEADKKELLHYLVVLQNTFNEGAGGESERIFTLVSELAKIKVSEGQAKAARRWAFVSASCAVLTIVFAHYNDFSTHEKQPVQSAIVSTNSVSVTNQVKTP